MSCKTTTLLAAYLDDSADAAGVLALLRERYPKSMSTYCTNIRKEWLALNKCGDHYRADMDRTIAAVGAWKAKADPTEAKLLETALHRLRSFDAMTMTERHAVLRSLRSNNYTGHVGADSLLVRVRILPDCVAALRLDAGEGERLQRKSAEALLLKSSTSFSVSAAAVLDIARVLLVSKKCNVFDLACALSLVTGRRMVELFSTGSFDPVTDDTHAASFAGQAKKQGVPGRTPASGAYAYKIPLLAPLDTVATALHRLRVSKDTEGLSNSEVNLRYSSSCNSAARRLLGEGRRFHDLRAVYGVMSFHLAMPHTLSLNMWLCKVLGHASLVNSLNYSSIHVTGVREEDKRQFVFDAASSSPPPPSSTTT